MRLSSLFAGSVLSVLAALSMPSHAVAPQGDTPLPDDLILPTLRATHDALDVQVSLLDDAGRDLGVQSALAPFRQRHGGDWEVRWDSRGNRANLVQGSGVPLLPGRGNALPRDAVQLSGNMHADLPLVAALAQQFIEGEQELLATAGLELQLDPDRSTGYGIGNTHWFIEFQQLHQGIPVDGAFVFVRIVHGNIVQFGAERIGQVHLASNRSTAPERDSAFAQVWQQLGFPAGTQITEWVEPGELRVFPLLPAGQELAQPHHGLRGLGYQHLLAWRYVFRVDEHSTWQVLLDTDSSRIIDLRDLTVNADAEVTGGVYPTTNTDPQIIVPFPFATVTNNGTKITNIDGVYDYTGGTASTVLNGRYFRMVDNCGSVSLSNNTTGNLAFGTSGGTDCTTPGFGGAGNTHATRTGFYHLTLINAKARSILPSNTWLQGTVTANMNVNNTCNASWNGSVNFYRSGGGCSNTGELAAVFLHEWGHGLDSNTGGSANENASGEAVGDTFAFLETRDSCIGPNFRPGVPCYNCTTCTGVRDLGDFALGGARTLATPANVTSDTGIDCDRPTFACPYYRNGSPYWGPMRFQGHCESLIASTANWDLKNALIDEFGEAGWQKMDDIWYGSLVPSKSAYQVASGGTCNANATVNGCGATNWYTVFLAVDDDDGNLANGTPNACRIWDSFNAHGIACGSRPACTETGGGDFSLTVPQDTRNICAGEPAAFAIDVGSIGGFSQPVTLSLTGAPAGVSNAFTPNPVVPGNGSTLSIGNTGALAAGSYAMTINGAASGSAGHSDAITLVVTAPLTTAPTLLTPANGATGVNLAPLLTWQAIAGATFTVEIASDAGFGSIVASQSGLTGNSWQAPALAANTTYWWRVSASGACGGAQVSAPASFTTGTLYCRAPNEAIPDNDATNGVTDTLSIAGLSGNVESVRLHIRANHTYVGDLSFTLSHEGTSVTGIDRPGVPASNFGCNGDNIDVVLDDLAANPVETACATPPPAIAGTLRPNAPLSAFAGLPAAGTWNLKATDAVAQDTGTLLEWCLDLSVSGETAEYTIGGTVSGLSGEGLVLALNGDETLAIDDNGEFVFDSTLTDGAAYAVSVDTQPSGPNQVCTIANGSGTISGGAVTNVAVNCVTSTYTVGGAVSGLAGNGLALRLNGGTAFAITGNGSFTLPGLLADGSSYAVTIATQPSGPNQVCTIANGSGTISGAAVTNVAVTCVTSTYAVGGTVSGLAGNGLALRLNGGTAFAISGNGGFTLPGPLTDGSSYAVTIATQPSGPNQVCTITNGNGTISGGAVTNAAVTCVTSTYAVGGTLSGLAGNGLALRLNGGAAFAISGNGGFTLPGPLADGSSYSVTIATQPSGPNQVCAIANGSGTISGGAVTNVAITCVTSTYTIGGTVSGLQGTGLSLSLNGGTAFAITGNGGFTLPGPLADGSSYTVTVATQPGGPNQVCTIANGSGTISGGAVTNVAVTCVTSTYTVGGTVSGLQGTGLSLSLNDGTAFAITGDGGFTLPGPLPDGSNYAVTIASQPGSPNQVCAIVNGSGTISGGAVTDVAVTCATSSYRVGGTVTGLLGNGLTLSLNGSNEMAVESDGSFVFDTTLLDGSSYEVTVTSKPQDPTQTCRIDNAEGAIDGADVEDIEVTCIDRIFYDGFQ